VIFGDTTRSGQPELSSEKLSAGNPATAAQYPVAYELNVARRANRLDNMVETSLRKCPE